MKDNPRLKYIFFGGKGGVGKTVMAGAAALWSAKQGRKTLLASTNPVHSLSNLFEQNVFGRPVMVCDEAHDALAIGGRQPLAGVGQSLGQPVDPETAVGVEHHLDYAGVSEKTGDGGAESGPQHAGPSKYRLRFLGRDGHVVPVLCGTASGRPWIGDD